MAEKGFDGQQEGSKLFRHFLRLPYVLAREREPMNSTAYLCRLSGDGNVLNSYALVHKQRQKLGEVHFVQIRALAELLRQPSLCSENLMHDLSYSWNGDHSGCTPYCSTTSGHPDLRPC